MKEYINLDGTKVGQNFDPYIVAEMSGNHNGKIENALAIIKEAKKCGANAVKIQTYKPDTITINHDSKEFIKQKGLWKGWKLFDLYEEAHTPWEWHERLYEYARKLDITLFSSPFDKTAVDFLENIGNPIYKIASPEIIDLELIKEVAKTQKPLILSTGMASKEEINEAIEVAKNTGNENIVVLHCTSAYPAPAEEANLITIKKIRDEFNVITGLSDHTEGTIISNIAIALGACLIEKHFIIDKKNGGVDSSFSIDSKELKSLVDQSILSRKSIGNPSFQPTSSEQVVLKNRRSLYVVRDIKEGDFLTTENIKSIRPGYGMLPKYISTVIGKRAKRKLKFGEPLQKDMFF